MAIPSLTRILYVEDEPDIQAIVKMALELIGGFTLQVCSRGKEAVEVAPDFKPDMILLDVMMPDMDGITTLKAIRQISSLTSTPVVFMTAKVQQQEIEYYKTIGAVDVICKPFDPMALPSTIQTIWLKYHGS